MRERTDFHSISKIILDNLDVNGLSKPEYIQTLFFYAFEQTEYKIAEPDTGDISRYIQGQRGIPKEIIRLYQENGNIKFLEQGMEDKAILLLRWKIFF